LQRNPDDDIDIHNSLRCVVHYYFNGCFECSLEKKRTLSTILGWYYNPKLMN
jgi:hypothetical protein